MLKQQVPILPQFVFELDTSFRSNTNFHKVPNAHIPTSQLGVYAIHVRIIVAIVFTIPFILCLVEYVCETVVGCEYCVVCCLKLVVKELKGVPLVFLLFLDLSKSREGSVQYL